MRSLRSLLNSLPTLLLALVIAIIIWAQAVRQPDPIGVTRFTVPVALEMLPEQILLSGQPDVVLVEIEARQSILNDLTIGDYDAVIDLTDAPYGQTSQAIRLQPQPADIEAVVLFPATVDVNLDRQITRAVPVTVLTQGSVAPGYTRGEPNIDPPALQITGPETIVGQIAEAETSILLNDAKEPFSSTRRPLLYDNQGNIVGTSSISVSPDAVTITMPVEEREGVRQKAITPRWTGDPAAGYRLLSVTVEPITALVSGSPAMLDNITLIPTEEVDITGLKQDTIFPATLQLAEGMTWEDSQPVVVSVEIEPIKTSAIITTKPEIVALGEGFTATLGTEEVRVFLFGPLEVLDTVKNEVRVVVDLFGLGEGSHTVEPNAIVPIDSIEVRSLQPEQITVQITVTETITPTGTPTVPSDTSSTHTP